jgi:hypothetical protein
MKTNRLLVQLAWATIIALITILLFFEKTVFDRQFLDTEDYLTLIIPALVLFVALMFLGQRLPLKILSIFIFIVNITISLTWLFIGNCMPLEEIEDGCTCDICGKNGQMILILLTAVVLPILLMIWSSHINQNKEAPEVKRDQIPISHTSLFAGIILVSIGGVSIFGYYFAPYLTVLLPVIMNICLIVIYRRHMGITSIRQEIQLNAIKIDLWRVFRDMGMLLLVGVFGFSTLDHDKFQFDLLLDFGIGFLAFWALIVILLKLTNIDLLQIARRLEVGILIVALISICTMIWVFTLGITTELNGLMPSAIPPIICGFIYSYLWLRIQLIAVNQNYPKSKYSIPLPRITNQSTNIFNVWLQLLLLFIVGIIKMSPEGTDAYLIFDLSAVIITILIVMWIIEFWKEKK